MLHCWLYRSVARTRPRSVEDGHIFLTACAANAAHGVTGFLHREDGFFVQYIEGVPVTLATLRQSIKADWRHAEVTTQLSAPIRQRRFAGWDMAFTDAEMASFREYQTIHGRIDGVSTAAPDDLLEFMIYLARSGRAGGLDIPGRSKTAPHVNARSAAFPGTSPTNPVRSLS